MHQIPPLHPVGFAARILNEKGINRLRFAGGEELLGHGAALIDATGQERPAAARFLLVAQATRAQHTFEAVIASCQIGRGVQAAMLNRSLLDDVLDIHWTAEHPDQAPERAEEHDRLIALAEHDLEDKFDRADRSLTDVERAELNKLMKLYAGERGKPFDRAWHRADFNECFALVKERWDNPPPAAYYLDYIYEVIQRRNNLLLHGSSTAYRQTLIERPDGRHGLNRIGPDQLWREALAHGAGGYYMVQRVLAQEFGLDRDPLASAFNQLSCYCRDINEFDGLAELPDDGECPCGTGRALSDCHRS